MPKSTFYNLPPEKREKVIRAGKEEFIRARDGDILIKNIVLNAGIPRGSFYQYFESKEDLIDFLIETNIKQKEDIFCRELDETGGDIFDAFENFFNRIVVKEDRNILELERKFMEHIKEFQQKYTNDKTDMPCMEKRFDLQRLLEHINIKELKVSSQDELFDIFYMIMCITVKNIMHFQSCNSKDLAVKSYKRELDYLRYGVLK